MLDRSPRRSVSNFRDRVGGGSVNMGVRRVTQLCEMVVAVPEVREMVAAARRFVDGEIHFSALVGPIALCEWWSRMNGEHSAVHVLAKRWELLVDRTWNEYGQHPNPLTVEELRQELIRDIEVLHSEPRGN